MGVGGGVARAEASQEGHQRGAAEEGVVVHLKERGDREQAERVVPGGNCGLKIVGVEAEADDVGLEVRELNGQSAAKRVLVQVEHGQAPERPELREQCPAAAAQFEGEGLGSRLSIPPQAESPARRSARAREKRRAGSPGEAVGAQVQILHHIRHFGEL